GTGLYEFGIAPGLRRGNALPRRAQLRAALDAAGAIVEVEQIDPAVAGGPHFDMLVLHDVEIDIGIAAVGHRLPNLMIPHAGDALGDETGFLVAEEYAETGGLRLGGNGDAGAEQQRRQDDGDEFGHGGLLVIDAI